MSVRVKLQTNRSNGPVLEIDETTGALYADGVQISASDAGNVSLAPLADQEITNGHSLTNTGGFVGDLTGDVAGNVTGNVTGNVVGNVQEPVTLAGADGAIAVKQGVVAITKAGVAVLTLASPVAGTDDGKKLTIIDVGGHAHTVTNAVTGFNAGGGASDVATFGGAKGDNLVVVAYNGAWYVISKTNITLG